MNMEMSLSMIEVNRKMQGAKPEPLMSILGGGCRASGRYQSAPGNEITHGFEPSGYQG